MSERNISGARPFCGYNHCLSSSAVVEWDRKPGKERRTMKEKTGVVFSVAAENPPVPGCTVSKAVADGLSYYSLAENTDISVEVHPHHKLLLMVGGEMGLRYGGAARLLQEGEALLACADVPVGMRTDRGAVYVELELERTVIMNPAISVSWLVILNFN